MPVSPVRAHPLSPGHWRLQCLHGPRVFDCHRTYYLVSSARLPAAHSGPSRLYFAPFPRLRSTGSSFDPLEVFVSGSGYGTRATRPGDIAEGEVFVNITRVATMDEQRAMSSSPVGPVFQQLYAEHGRGMLMVP